jgi:hypothetical protein
MINYSITSYFMNSEDANIFKLGLNINSHKIYGTIFSGCFLTRDFKN